jgi:hypothetical protein
MSRFQGRSPPTLGRRPAIMIAVAAATMALAAQSASAARVVQPADLSELRARSAVRDSVIRVTPRAGAADDRTEVFVDQHGHRITLSTPIDGLDLTPYASVLAGTIHYDEIEDVAVWVLSPPDVQAVCGADALACYGPEDAATSNRGTLVIPSTDPDLQHIIVHEYGHHVDNQVGQPRACLPGRGVRLPITTAVGTGSSSAPRREQD